MRNTGKKKRLKLEMKKEYDFSHSRPNRFIKRYSQGTNVVLIDPDLAKKFPTSEKVNEALRFLSSILNVAKSYPKKVFKSL